jgi:tetratricopeptide (TPR) repeat protein
VPATVERACDAIAVAALVLLGGALLAIAFGPHRIGDYFTETDFYGAYADGARLLQHGQLVPSRYGVVGPGYEVVLAFVGLLVRDLFRAAEVISVASVLVTVALWAALLRHRVDARAAAMGTLVLATNPVLIRFGYSATTDATALALQTLALWLLLTRPSPRGAFLAGAAAALAFLTRYSAGTLLPAGLVAIAAGGTGAPRRAAAAGAFLAGFLLPVAPWVAFSVTHGAGVSFQLHHNIAFEVFARPRGIPWDEYQKTLQPQFHSLWDVIARDPRAVASRLAFNLVDHLRLDARDLLGWPMGVAAALGALVTLTDRAARRLWPVLLHAALAFLALVPAFHAPRYSLAILPAYAALVAVLFASPRYALPLGRVRLKSVLAALPLAAALAGAWTLQSTTLRILPVEVLEAAAVLRAEAKPGDVLIARKPHLAWIAGLDGRPFPFADSLAQLAESSRRQRARWLFVSWPEVETRPSFWFLLDTTGTVPGLTPRCVTAPHPSVLYAVGPDFGRRPAWMDNDTLVAWHSARARLLVNPDDAEALFMLGLIQSTRERADSAVTLLEHSVRVDPRRVSAWLVLADVALRRGDADGAERAAQGALSADPANVQARAALGWVSAIAGRDDEAAARWRPLVDSVHDVGTLRRMAEVFTRTGDIASADAARAALARLGARP